VTVEGPSAASHPDVIETETRDIVVPDLSGSRVALSTPAVFIARTARDFRELSVDASAIPAVTRQFSRTDRLLIRFEVYGAPTAVSARLLNRGGDAMTPLPVDISGPRPGEYVMDFPLATLARGDYVVEITAKGETGEAKELIPIRVTG